MSGKAYLRNQGQVVGGDARQFGMGNLDAAHFKSGADEDVVDAHARKAAGKGGLGAVVFRLGLSIPERTTEPAAHRR